MKKRTSYMIAGYICAALIYALTVYVYRDYIFNNSDVGYLLNRARQMSGCIRDGNIPWFYYNDFFGLGYGSSFFYGQLTLYPFLPVLALSEKAFVCCYIAACALVNMFGAGCLFKRFGKQYPFMTLLYLTTEIALDSILVLKLYANALGIGISLFFFAYCIDFFRDKKSFVPATVAFFILINTHFISAVMAFAGCAGMMLYYFNKKQIGRYALFAVVTAFACSYNLANMFYHRECLNDTAAINAYALRQEGMEQFLLGNIPFSSALHYLFTGSIHTTAVCSVAVFIWLVYSFVKRKKKKKREWVLFLLCVCGILQGTQNVWQAVTQTTGILFFQFPVRYAPYLMIILIVLGASEDRKGQAVASIYSIVYLFVYVMLLATLLGKINAPASGGLDGLKKYDSCYVGNGEYVSGFCIPARDFEWTATHVADDTGKLYSYQMDKDRLMVNISRQERDITLQIPKLYYRGYRAVMEDGSGRMELSCTKGYSSLINVTIPAGKSGYLYVVYVHPFWLKALDFVCLMTVCVVYVLYIVKYHVPKSGTPENSVYRNPVHRK